MSMTRAHRETGELIAAAKSRRQQIAERIMRRDRRVLEMLAPHDGPAARRETATTADSVPLRQGQS